MKILEVFSKNNPPKAGVLLASLAKKKPEESTAEEIKALNEALEAEGWNVRVVGSDDLADIVKAQDKLEKAVAVEKELGNLKTTSAKEIGDLKAEVEKLKGELKTATDEVARLGGQPVGGENPKSEKGVEGPEGKEPAWWTDEDREAARLYGK